MPWLVEETLSNDLKALVLVGCFYVRVQPSTIFPDHKLSSSFEPSGNPKSSCRRMSSGLGFWEYVRSQEDNREQSILQVGMHDFICFVESMIYAKTIHIYIQLLKVVALVCNLESWPLPQSCSADFAVFQSFQFLYLLFFWAPCSSEFVFSILFSLQRPFFVSASHVKLEDGAARRHDAHGPVGFELRGSGHQSGQGGARGALLDPGEWMSFAMFVFFKTMFHGMFQAFFFGGLTLLVAVVVGFFGDV